jgi:hypothetical protein
MQYTSEPDPCSLWRMAVTAKACPTLPSTGARSQRLFFLPLMSAVASPAKVTYRCQRSDSAWPPGSFTVELSATAGRSGCGGRASATASVTTIKKSTIDVQATMSLVTICKDATATTVNVTYQLGPGSYPVKQQPSCGQRPVNLRAINPVNASQSHSQCRLP